MIKTCEFVSPSHPDKQCDIIADTLLDLYLEGDKDSRVAIEVMGGHGVITLSGEVTSKSDVNVENVVKGLVGQDYQVVSHITKQSEFIAKGVDAGGAGDQGIMVGYACRDTENFMPKEYELARNLCIAIYKEFPYDGKTQVTIEGDDIPCVVASFQNTKTAELEKLVKDKIKANKYLINPAGEWTLGGFDADSGLTGRKVIVDNYGPQVSVGGGSFSGKDMTKVDRSGAYVARKLAVWLLKGNSNAHTAIVRLAYAIGVQEPVMAYAEQYSNTGVWPTYLMNALLTPKGIRAALNLDSIKLSETATWGHFGRNFPWDS